MLDQHRKEMHEQFSQILSAIGKSKTPKPEAPTFAITTRSGVSTRDPPFPVPLKPTPANHTEGAIEKEGPEGAEPNITHNEDPVPWHPFFTNPPTIIHMPKGAKVLKDLLSHKEKLEKAASSVKLSEECSAIIQRSLPKNKETQEASHFHVSSDPWQVCMNLLVKVSKFIFPVDFVVLEIDEDELVPIILGRPFLATTRVVIDVREGKLSFRVGSEIVTFNIRKSMKSKHSRDDYLYCADYTAKLIQEQWVDMVDHDGKWTKVEEEEDSNEENNQLPVVISSALSTIKKAKLLEVLKNHKRAIAWSIADIKGIDSSFCTHKILMEDEFKPSVQPQRRVKLNIKNVVKKKAIKLLDA
ncbi:DNA-directed DNA polymerase [Tanacetum coccineum]